MNHTYLSLVALCNFSTLLVAEETTIPTPLTVIEQVATKSSRPVPHFFTALAPLDMVEEAPESIKEAQGITLVMPAVVGTTLEQVVATSSHAVPYIFATLAPLDVAEEATLSVSETREKTSTLTSQELQAQTADDKMLLGIYTFASGGILTASATPTMLPLVAIAQTLPLIAGVAATVYFLDAAKKLRHAANTNVSKNE